MSKFIEDAAAFIESQPFRIIRLTEIKNNGEPETYEQTPANPCQNIYSVAKTFTMTAIGLLYDRGLVKTDDKLVDILFDDIPGYITDKRWLDVTVDMLLTHKAGLPGGFLDIDVNKSSLFGEDFLKYTLSHHLEYDPGTNSKYSDGVFYLLALIAEKLSGEPIDNFLWKELFLKLDFQEAAWSRCPKGHPMGATGLYISSVDMAKLGVLYLNKGIYNGIRILSEEWVDLVFENEYALSWDEDKKVISKGGMCGQRLMIVPDEGRVVALQSFGGNSNAVCEWVKNYR